MAKLEHVLQSLIDTKIPITITGLWDNGLGFAFVSLKSAIAHDTERAPQADINPLSDVDARYAYKRDLTETLEKL